MKNNLDKLAKELNQAHTEYLKVKGNIKSDDYKKAKNIYLALAEEYREAFYKAMKKGEVDGTI